MLQAHSLLWHYLWIGPHVLQLGLAILLIRRGIHKRFPIFLTYLFFEGIEEFILYALDVLPSVTGETFWAVFSVGLIVEGLLKFALAGELFVGLLRAWPSIANTGKHLITAAGVILVFTASLVAAFTAPGHSFWLISGAHVLQESMDIIESGLVLFMFLFAAYFKLTWTKASFGILLGLGIHSFEHLGAWAVVTNELLGRQYLLDFLNMATYHVCVLIWFYYLLSPQKVATAQRPVRLPEHNLEVWNRELERLLQ